MPALRLGLTYLNVGESDMMKLKLTAVLIALTAMAACSQPEPEPVPVMPEPVYDKYGNQVG